LKGPARGLPNPAAGTAAAQPEGADAGAVHGGETAPNRIELLLGDENVTATFEVEIVDFAAPASEESAAESLP
jgi:hypothetical protein